MIVCSCAVISTEDIERAISWMRAADPDVLITPGRVYRALGKKPACGACSRLFVEFAHLCHTPDNDAPALRAGARIGGTRNDEGRRQGHRLPEQGTAARIDGG